MNLKYGNRRGVSQVPNSLMNIRQSNSKDIDNASKALSL